MANGGPPHCCTPLPVPAWLEWTPTPDHPPCPLSNPAPQGTSIRTVLGDTVMFQTEKWRSGGGRCWALSSGMSSADGVRTQPPTPDFLEVSWRHGAAAWRGQASSHPTLFLDLALGTEGRCPGSGKWQALEGRLEEQQPGSPIHPGPHSALRPRLPSRTPPGSGHTVWP